MKTVELRIEGMSCGHCVMAVRKELSKISGVQIDEVQIGSAKMRLDEKIVRDEQLNRAVENAGYRLVSIQ